NTAAVLRYFRFDKFAKVCLPLGERAFIVRTDQPAVTSHIGRENGHEPSVNSLAGHINAPTALSAQTLCPGAPRVSIGRHCPVGVKMRKAHCEQMFSGLPPCDDIGER